MYVHCSYMSVLLHNHTSFPIRPDQPCDAGESPHRAGAAPSEQPQYTCIYTVLTRIYMYLPEKLKSHRILTTWTEPDIDLPDSR